ncbi:ATP-binding protein [Kiritimatiella glycovorans]|uniref:Chromosome segregation protein n=1 Tax=Kiritimatiella glycovorans TaxID=1307763 RepID=A0A0G3EKS2_9BACT|nr:ATP-binding protein [Kiritimatiella glycovorans]AKJ64774.1 chromosome segregation protein [Kiritimatiella glycovorans]
MKYIRLRIANYRGIDASEITFGASGITLAQGPNEAGKTSLSEASWILFEFPDNSKHKKVKAISPVHRDVGPEIELEAESGPYAFTYSKRFLKKPETKLVVTKPKPENYTGRDAHDRAETILKETLDVNLWKALSIQQGDAIDQPKLTDQTSLSAALDKTAGGQPADPEEEDLFEKAREEYARYYTGTGQEKKDLQEARNSQESIEADIAEVERKLGDLYHDIDRVDTLQHELEGLKNREEELKKEVAGHTASLDEIGRFEAALETAQAKLESANKTVEAARRDRDAREDLIKASDQAAKEHGELQENSKMAFAALNQAEENFKKAQKAANKSEQNKKTADARASLRRADYEYYTNKLFLDQLRERKERIDRARESAGKAEETLAQAKIDPKALKAIEKAELDLATAKAHLDTRAPSVLLRALSKSTLHIDKAETVLDKDEVQTLSVADRLRLTVPDMLDIEITAGSSLEEHAKKVDAAQKNLDDACRSVDVADPEQARRAMEAKKDASRQVEEKNRVEKENLFDLTYEDLSKKLRSLEQSVPEYLSKRDKEPAISPDMGTAKDDRAKAESALEEANEQSESSRTSLDAARNVRDDLSAKHQEARVQIDLLKKDAERKGESLARARKAAADKDLNAAVEKAAQDVAGEEKRVRSAEEALKAKNPERVKALAETAEGSLQTTRNRRNDAQTELTQAQERLRIHGEEGLHEKLHAAQTSLERIEASNRALNRRAAAARLLFETMREERDKARQAYVAPLKEGIEHLGRLLFDDTFQVEISEDLQIASRTLSGITEPFEFLSGGTKEQLSLIFRLACSVIVAKDGGMPLVLDDALGYTDPDRLRLMGAVLAKAAKNCQIVIFTCVPERYAHIGEANVIPIR